MIYGHTPKAPKWKWVVFGDENLLVVFTPEDISLWRRLVSKLVLGSRWIRLS